MRGMLQSRWWPAAAVVLGICWWASADEPPLPRKFGIGNGENPAAKAAENLPPGAIIRLGSLRFTHVGGVSAMRFTPDGKHLVTAGYDGTVRFWDTKTGQPGKVLGKPTPTALIVQPQGAAMLSISGDGKFVAVSVPQRQQVRLWNVDKEEETGLFGDNNQMNYQGFGFALNHDGSRLALADLTGKIKLYDTGEKKEAKTLSGHDGAVLALAYSADGKTLLSGGMDMTVRLWTELEGDEPKWTEVGNHRDAVRSVALSADGRRAASSGTDGMARLWNIADQKQLARFDVPRYYAQRSQLNSVQLSADGKLLAAVGMNGGMTVWDADKGSTLVNYTIDINLLQQQQQFAAGGGAVSPDGALAAAAGPNGRILVYDLKNQGKRLTFGEGHSGMVFSAVVSPNGKWVATGGSDATVRIWDLASGKQVHLLDAHIGAVGYLSFTRNSKYLFSASMDYNDKAVSMWDVESGKEVKTFAGNTPFGYGSSVAVSADGKYIASLGTDLSVQVREVETKKELFRTPGQIRAAAMTFTADGKSLIVLGFDIRGVGMSFNKLSIPEGKVTELPNAKVGQSLVLGLSVDGRYCVLSAFDGSAPRVVDLSTGRDLRTLGDKGMAAGRPIFGGRVGGASQVFSFSADSRAIAGPGPDNAVSIWELATGKERIRFEGHNGLVTSAAFTPDGNRLITASADNTVLIWDLTSAGKDKPAELKPDELWNVLTSDDAAKAYAAMRQMVAAPKDAVELIRQRLKPTVAVDGKQIQQYITNLDSEEIAVRKKAVTELEKLGDIAEPYIRKALADKPTLDVKQRLEELLSKIQTSTLTPDQLRGSRCIEVLEKLGNGDARQVLEKIAAGEAGDKLTRWARESLERMDLLVKKPQ